MDIDDLINRLRYGVACPVSGVTGDLAKDMTEAANALETLRQQLNGMMTEHGKRLDECARLRAELEEARKDAERLNWLDEVNRRTNERNGTVYGWKFDMNHNRAALMDHNFPALSIRAAIDAARQQQA